MQENTRPRRLRTGKDFIDKNTVLCRLRDNRNLDTRQARYLQDRLLSVVCLMPNQTAVPLAR
jgi:hypothetical protein